MKKILERKAGNVRVIKKPEQRRREIIAAARELFDRNGIRNTQISQIVKKVGVAQGLFYYYFSSKEEVVNAVVQEVLDEIQQSASSILLDETKSFYEKLSGYIRLYLKVVDQFTGDNEKDLRGLRESISNNPIARDAHDIMINQLLALMRQGEQNGAVKIEYPADMALMIVYGITQIAQTRLVSESQLLRMIEQGLSLPKGVLSLRP